MSAIVIPKIVEFTQFLRDRDYAKEDIDRFSEIIEPIESLDEGRHLVGYRIKPLQSADRVTQKCAVLVQYAWHCRDYVKKILIEHEVKGDIGATINRHINKSRDAQVVSYLANSYKHAGADSSQRWAKDIAPKFGKPYVIGWLASFPGEQKPFVRLIGNDLPGLEFTGHAKDRFGKSHQFSDFTWQFSCEVEDQNGKIIGNTFDMCERSFELLFQILTANHIPMVANAV